MRNDKRLLPVIVIVILISGASVFLMQQTEESDGLQGAPRSYTDEAEDHAARRGDVPGHTLIRGESNPGEPAAVAVPAQYAADSELDFSAAIRSGDARATFKLMDKRGAPIEPTEISSAELWRKLGPYWSREGTTLRHQQSEILCAGFNGSGLEAGEYELRVRCGGYGAVARTFRVAAGQVINATLELPRWRRIIRLRYVDENGAPLSFIPNTPTYYEPEAMQLPGVKRKGAGRLLAPPPDYGLNEQMNDSFGLGGGSGSSGYRSGRPSRKFLTDNGAWHMRVFAGGEGTFQHTLSKRYDGRESIKVKSDFTGPEWDDYEITLKYDSFRLERNANRKPSNPENPGNIKVLAALPHPEKDPREVNQYDSLIHRLIFEPRSSVDLDVEVEAPRRSRSRNVDGERRRNRQARKKKNTWYTDVFYSRNNQVAYHYTDGALLQTGKLEHDFDAVARSKRLSFVRDVVPANRCTVEASLPTPTSRAWARELKIAWSELSENIWKHRATLAEGDRFTVKTAVSLDGEDQDEGLEGRKIVLSFDGEGYGEETRFTFPLDAAEAQSLKDGFLQLAPAPRGLIVRAIDENGAGLPWVEASIIPVEKLVTALKLKERMLAWRKAERTDRHYLATLYQADLEHDESAKLAGTPADDITALVAAFDENTLRHVLKDGLYDELESDEERRHYASNFTWYSTHRKLKSGSRGYLCNWKEALKPGRRYAIFFWSKSRDHLAPDAMKLFTAEEGLTDLGAVLLPGYD